VAKAKQTHSRIAARLTEDMAEVAAQATKKKDSTISTLVEKKLKKLKLKELRELLQNQNRSTEGLKATSIARLVELHGQFTALGIDAGISSNPAE